MKVLFVQDQVIYKTEQGLKTPDIFYHWIGEVGKHVDVTVAARVFDVQNGVPEYGSFTTDIQILNRMHNVPDNIKVVSLPEFGAFTDFIKHPELYVKFNRKIKGLIKDFDVIITNLATPTALFTWLAVDNTKQKIVSIARSNILNDTRFRYKGIKRAIMHSTAKTLLSISGRIGHQKQVTVICIGEDIRRLVSKVGLNARVMLRAFYREDIKKQAINTQKLYIKKAYRILTVTRFEPEKGVDVLIEAARYLHTVMPHLKWYVVGRGNLKDHYLSLIKQYGLEDFLIIKDFMPFNELQELYKWADLFVNPSYTEGIPSAMMEASLWGLPSVATSVGGIPWLFPHLDSAYLVQSGEPWALAQGIIIMMKNQDMRQKIGTNARAIASTYSLESSAKKFADFLKNL